MRATVSLARKTVDPDRRRHHVIADRIISMIDAGTLRPGDRVPSVRGMSRQNGVAVGTVLHAYRTLENRGRIAARPQSGFYVCSTGRPLPEPRLSIPPRRPGRPTVGDLVARMNRMTLAPDVIPLGHAIPSPACLPTRRLTRISAAIARRCGRGFDSYDVPPGCQELRVQVARHFMSAGCALSPDDIITTCGCQEALGLCLRAAVPAGGVVAVESPCFYGILQAIDLLGMKSLELPTDPRTGVDLAALERAIRKRNVAACLFATNCHNPLGFITADEKKRELVKLLARHDIPLIEDDTYGDLSFVPDRPTVCKAYDDRGRVMLCSSFSKTVAPGARVGWCAPGRFLDRVMQLKFCNTIATATLPQLAVAEYLADGGYACQLRKMRRVYAEQVRLITVSVQRHFPPGTRASRPAGGHVLWLELPAVFDSMELFERAAAFQISVAPGPLFSTDGGYPNFLRLNCACECDARLEQAIRVLGQLAREQLQTFRR